MPKPENDDATIPGWPVDARWRDLVFEADCSAKPQATQVVDVQGCDTHYNMALGKNVTDCTNRPIYAHALEEARTRCAFYKAWLSSPDGATEYLGSQYGITQETADTVLDGSAEDAYTVYRKVIGTGLTLKEFNSITALWNARTQAAFGTILQITPNMLPFIPIWNKMKPAIRDWFCIFRPWVPITVYKQEQAKLAKLKMFGQQPIGAPKGLPKGAKILKGKAPAGSLMILPWCVDVKSPGASTAAQVKKTQKATREGTTRELERRQDAQREMMQQAHIDKVAQFAAICQPGEVIYHKGIKYECWQAQEGAMPDSQKEPEDQDEPKPTETAPSPLPWVLGGVGVLAGGPIGGAAGYAAGVALAQMAPTYVGNGFTGIDPTTGGSTYAEKQKAAKVAKCQELLNYLDANGLDAIAAALQAKPHNNADFLDQKNQLAPDIRELVHECAYFASELMLEEAWAELTPKEQAEHTKWFQEKAKKATAGKPGVTAFCPPGMAPAECKQKIEAEIDAATCKGINVPLGTVAGRTASFCVSTRLIVGAAAGVAALVWLARK